jgi:hypothetical protein
MSHAFDVPMRRLIPPQRAMPPIMFRVVSIGFGSIRWKKTKRHNSEPRV